MSFEFIGHREQPPRAGGVLHPRPRPHRSRSPAAEGRIHELIEHAFDATYDADTNQQLKPDLWIKTQLGISCFG